MNSRGQIAVEAVLLATVILALIITVSESFRRQGILSNLVEGPWTYVDGMARHGVWAPRQRAMSLDPNFSPRRASQRAEVER